MQIQFKKYPGSTGSVLKKKIRCHSLMDTTEKATISAKKRLMDQLEGKYRHKATYNMEHWHGPWQRQSKTSLYFRIS